METLKLIVSNYYIDVGSLHGFLPGDQDCSVLSQKRYFSGGADGWRRRYAQCPLAFVCSITIAIAKKIGFASPEFALAVLCLCGDV